ncbi:MAG: protein translocase subunit SecD, partial [Phycisphaerae bacterium]
MDKALNQRLLIIGIVTLLAVWLIYPPKDRLKPGLDIAGGTAMIFEIDEDEGDFDPYLAENMKAQLQKRVDPKGVYDLVWRVVGRNRLEVQMPLSPAANKELREAFEKAQEDLFKSNVKRTDLESALARDAAGREEEFTRLSGGSQERIAAMRKAAEQHDKKLAAQKALAEFAPPASTPTTAEATQPTRGALEIALRDATEAFEDAVDAVMSKNLDPRRFTDLLELDENSQIRKASLDDLKKTFPNLASAFDATIEKYKGWKAQRAFLDSPQDLIRLMRGAGVLEFRIMTQPEPGNPTKFDRYREQLEKYGASPQRGDTDQWFKIDNPVAFLNLASPKELGEYNYKNAPYHVVEKRGSEWYALAKRGPEHGLLADKSQTPWRLKNAGEDRDQRGRRCVRFVLDPIGGSRFGELTRSNISQQLGIFVDGVAYSAANIESEIRQSGIITGDFSAEKVQYLVNTMQAGALPARLKDTPISERTVGSSLGQTNLNMALRAGQIGLAIVIVVMIVYYGVSGAVANVGMLLNLLFTLAAMAMLGARFNLAGIAGVILSLGMAVDANILIFERMREEKERGSSLRMIIRNGYDKALTTILDSNITTLLTCLIIYYVGSEEIKGFGLTLGWGIALNVFTAVFVTRTLYMVMLKFNLIKDIRMMKLIGVTNVDWYGLRKKFVPASATIILIGLALLVLRGPRDLFDVEFLGGVNAEFQIRDAVAAEFDDVRVRKLIEEAGSKIEQAGSKLASATATSIEGDASGFIVKAPGVPAAMLAAMITEPLESGESGELLQRGGVSMVPGDPEAVLVRVKTEMSPDAVRGAVAALADRGGDSVPLAGENIRRANIASVLEVGGEKGKFFTITTTETNKALVRYALVDAIGESLQTTPQLAYEVKTPEGRPVPVTERRLDAVLRGLPAGIAVDTTDYLGGAAVWFDNVDPPQT